MLKKKKKKKKKEKKKRKRKLKQDETDINHFPSDLKKGKHLPKNSRSILVSRSIEEKKKKEKKKKRKKREAEDGPDTATNC